MMDYVNKLDRWLSVFERGTIVLLFSLLIVLMLVNIALRNLFSYSSHNIFELLPAIVLWITLMGASYTIRERGHIKLEILSHQFSKKIKHYSNILMNFFSMVVMALLCVAGVIFLSNEIQFVGKWGLISVIFPIFFFTSCFRFFLRCVHNILLIIKSQSEG